MVEAQAGVIAFLSEGSSYGAPEGLVERIETHISIVFLAGERAYKLKRAVKFSYVDYSTPARAASARTAVRAPAARNAASNTTTCPAASTAAACSSIAA